MIIKRILGIFLALNFFNLTAEAGTTNLGINLSMAQMDATGSHTTNQSTTVTENRSADFQLASIFAERQMGTGRLNFALGLDVIPVEREIDKLGGATGFDATIKMSPLVTAYIQPMIVGDKFSLFARAGLSQADLEITNISRQATTAGTASTDGAQSKNLKGTMYGIGVQYNTEKAFVRLVGTHTEFDEITHTNSNSKTLKATPEVDLISLSIGKAF